MAEKKKADAGAEGAGKPKNKMMPLMLIVAVVAVVAIVGTLVVGKQVSAKSKKGHVKKVEPGPVLTLDEFLVNLADPSGDHFLKVTIGLELDKEKGKSPEGLKEQVPQIRDAVLTALSSQTRDDLIPLAGREKLKVDVKKKVNAALGEDDVRSVLFTNFVTQ